MHYKDRLDITNEAKQWIHNTGYWITLNARTKDRIQFEQDLVKLSTWLNDYCYGRQFKRAEKRLKIIAAIESGKVNGGLHSHLVVTHPNDTSRSFQEINEFVRKRWYRLNRLKDSIFGTMVNVQLLGNAETRIDYAAKDLNSYFADELNIIYL